MQSGPSFDYYKKRLTYLSRHVVKTQPTRARYQLKTHGGGGNRSCKPAFSVLHECILHKKFDARQCLTKLRQTFELQNYGKHLSYKITQNSHKLRARPHLRSGAADLAHFAVMQLRCFRGQLGLCLRREHFLALPRDACLRGLLLVIVVGGSTVQGRIVTWGTRPVDKT